MSEYQTTLGEGGGIAEELAEGQRAISIAEFFEKNKHMLGFDSGARGLVTAVKEAVDNALDATEEAELLPDIYVEIIDEGDYYRLIVEDNGPGITKESLPKVFGKLLYGSRFHVREQSLTPDQQILIRRGGEVTSISIGTLCDAYLSPTGADMRPMPSGVEVPSFNRETGVVTWQPVTHAIRHETDEQTYQVTTVDGRTVEVTGNHSLFAMDSEGNPTEVPAETIESGDNIVVPATIPTVASESSNLNESGVVSKQQSYQDNVTIETVSVQSVERTIPPSYVYDISVPGATGVDENFVVSNNGPICVKNSRGQQGIGISAAVLYSQLTSGKPAKITSRTQGSSEAQYFELIIDTESNEPEIKVDETTSWDRPHGTRIELEMEANMRGRSTLHDYIKHTAVVNPHARIELNEPNHHFKFERATDQLPEETEEIRPHPHGVELGTLMKMLEATDSHSLSGFLQEEFTRVGRKTATSIIDGFRDGHFGREMTWAPPDAAAIEDAVTEATSNKGTAATADFAGAIATAVTDHDRIAHHQLEAIVDAAADDVEKAHETPFGATVRENAVAAAWAVIAETATDEEDTQPRIVDDLDELVRDATSSRKDDAVVRGFAERLAGKFDDLEDRRHRLTKTDLTDRVDRAADLTEERDDVAFGETARENVVEALWTAMLTVPDDAPKVSTVAADRDGSSALLEAMRAADIMAPPTHCLSPISADLIEAGLKKEYDADFYAAATRDADVSHGDPFIVEAGIAYGGELDPEGSADVLRFANRVPLVYQRGACAITDVVKSIGWRNYNLDQPGGSGIPNGPAVIMVHVASTNVPFTSESKDAVANVPEIEDEIELAIREAARELKSYLNKRQSMEKRRRKQNVLAKILPEMATKVAEITGRDEPEIGDALGRIMNNVLVERELEPGDDGSQTVRLQVENLSDRTASLEITDIVSSEPAALSDGASVVEVDGEWFVSWEPAVSAGEEATLEYTVADSADFTIDVDGVEAEKLTVSA